MPTGPSSAGYYKHGPSVISKQDLRSIPNLRDAPGAYREKIVIDAGITNPKELRSVAIHEFQHYLTKGSELVPSEISRAMDSLLRGDMGDLMDFWRKKDLRVQKLDGTGWTTASKATDDEIGLSIRYYIKDTEIQARMQQVRRQMGVKPGKKITKKDITKIVGKEASTDTMTKSATQDLIDVLGSKDKLVKALNTLPAIVPMAVEDELFNQWDREDNLF